jgi:anaerobic ribonucleoside-triphosphate reductase-like protein
MNDMTQTRLAEPTITLKDEERQRCEIWTRVMGYHRPVSSFNIGKKGEFYGRRFFEEQRNSSPVEGAAVGK